MHKHPYFLLLIAPLFLAGNAVAGKLADGLIAPMTLTLLRWGLAVIIITPLAWPKLRRDWPIIRHNLLILMLYGVFGFTLFNILLYNALTYTSVIHVSIVQATIPMLTLILGGLLFRQTVRGGQVIAAILTFSGVVLTVTGGEVLRLLESDINRGDLFMLLASLAYAMYSLALRYKPNISWWSFIAVLAFFAMLASIPFAWYEIAQATTPTFHLNWESIALILYVALFPSLVAQLAYAVAVSSIGAAQASISINLIPVFGVLLAVVLLGETLHSYHIFGMLLVFFGIGASEWSRHSSSQFIKPNLK